MPSPRMCGSHALTRGSARECGEECVHQRTVARALPAGNDVVHDVAEGDLSLRIGEPDCTPRAEVTETARMRAEWSSRHGWIEAQAERHLVVEDGTEATRL